MVSRFNHFQIRDLSKGEAAKYRFYEITTALRTGSEKRKNQQFRTRDVNKKMRLTALNFDFQLQIFTRQCA
jgi:hypothetical protein